jgi:hypothetical protein
MHAPKRLRALAALCLPSALIPLASTASAQSFPSSCSPTPGATHECSGLHWTTYRYHPMACNCAPEAADVGSAVNEVLQVDGWNASVCPYSISAIGWKTDPAQGVGSDCSYNTLGLPLYNWGVEQANLFLHQLVETHGPPTCSIVTSTVWAFASRAREFMCPDQGPGWTWAGAYCYRSALFDRFANNGDCPSGCPRGNPVNPATGNKYERQVDYVGNGPFAMRIERFYNSLMRIPNDPGSVFYPTAYFQSLGELGAVQGGFNRNGVSWRH